ncbi:MAG TPA: hypothetical protein VNV43_10880 [Candidatus Acidoferrales bacterium]|nr:hypothetical protein [Candidatus Acidoferrales bacterium]
MLFGGIPLNKEPAGEGGITHPANDFPNTPVNAEEFAVVPNGVMPDKMG